MERETKCDNDKKAFPERCSSGAFWSIVLVFVLVLGLFVVVGCATDQSVRLPPVASNPNGEVYVGKFVWIDLLTEDVAKATIKRRSI